MSFVCGIYIAGKAILFGSSVSGWSSIIVFLYFLGGIIISILGILGVYLGKTFDEVKKRPLYLVRNKTETARKSIKNISIWSQQESELVENGCSPKPYFDADAGSGSNGGDRPALASKENSSFTAFFPCKRVVSRKLNMSATNCPPH